MSDDYLKIVPADMDYVPPSETHRAAIKLLECYFPGGEECDVEVHDTVQFIDQGENLEKVHCPSCTDSVKIDFLKEGDPGASFWFDLSGSFGEKDMSAIAVAMPCCGKNVPFTSLTFDWPAAFACFELYIRNPESGENLNAQQLEQLERVLGCTLKQVRAHY